jgi:hypothetical protein
MIDGCMFKQTTIETYAPKIAGDPQRSAHADAGADVDAAADATSGTRSKVLSN